jgi:AraC-like DNA-binding protein/signal transduction histidine kinase
MACKPAPLLFNGLLVPKIFTRPLRYYIKSGRESIKYFRGLLYFVAFFQHSIPAAGIPNLPKDPVYTQYYSHKNFSHHASQHGRLTKTGDNGIHGGINYNSDEGNSMFDALHRLAYRNFWVYLLPFLVFLWGARKYELSRIRLRNRYEIASVETQKLRELDEAKTRLFTGISREIRTPLTLIKGRLEQLIDEIDDQGTRKNLSSVYENSFRLLHLSNQLFDLSLIKNENYQIEVVKGNVINLIKGIAMLYSPLAEKKKIILKAEEHPHVKNPNFSNNFYYDPGIIEKVMINLLSHIIKGMAAGGRISIKIGRNRDNTKEEFLEIIIVSSSNDLTIIKDHFAPEDRELNNSIDGSWVELALIKELVTIHKGGIHVNIEKDAGTIIKIHFFSIEGNTPMLGSAPGKQLPSSVYYEMQYSPSPYYGKAAFVPEYPAVDHIIPSVLLFEYYAEVGEYITEILQKDYRVIKESETETGWQKAVDLMPDLIIIEAEKPENGCYRLIENLKNNDKTSHIPVILLIAIADENDKIRLLNTGVDGFMIKPFSAKELIARVGNLISGRRKLREKFTRGSLIQPGETVVNSRDSADMKRLLEVVEKNIGNHGFSVRDLGREVGMSKSQVHRKLKALVKMSGTRYIRTIRMNKAMELLKKDAGTISEIAYMVGYDDPGYFARSFRNVFGKSPSDMIRKK